MRTRAVSEFTKHWIMLIAHQQNLVNNSNHEMKDYFKLAYQTARNKSHLLQEHFRTLLLRLLGDKNHQQVFEAVAKVEKTMVTTDRLASRRPEFSPSQQRPIRDFRLPHCFFCQKPGHFYAQCLARRVQLRPGQSSSASQRSPGPPPPSRPRDIGN